MDQQQNAQSAAAAQGSNPFEPQYVDFDPSTLREDLQPPRVPLLDSSVSTPRESTYAGSPPSPTNSSPLLLAADTAEKGPVDQPHGQGLVPPKNRRLTRILLFAIPIGLILLALVIALPVYFTVVKKPTSQAASSTSSSSSSSAAAASATPRPSSRPTGAISGGDGSTVTQEDGNTFIYRNPFGGICKSGFISYDRAGAVCAAFGC